MKNSVNKRALALLLTAAMVFEGAAPARAYAKEEQENVQEEAVVKENTVAEGEAETADADTKENEAAQENAGTEETAAEENTQEEGRLLQTEEDPGQEKEPLQKQEENLQKEETEKDADTPEENFQRAEIVKGAEASEGDYTYQELEDGTIEITKYNGAGGEVQIPAEIDGKKVTSIGTDAFLYCEGLINVTISEGVMCIGDYAFHGCRNLTSVKIPGSVTSIGDSVFSGCRNLIEIKLESDNHNYLVSKDGILYDKSVIRLIFCPRGKKGSMEIPASVTNIGGGAFAGCDSLTSVSIPEGVTNIGDYAFEGCSGLTSVSIPEGVMNIGDYVFEGCSGLTSVSIPGGVTNIGNYVFYGCYNLASVEIPKGVTSIGTSAFLGCRSLTNVEIPEGVISIGQCAFQGCSDLTSMKIPRSVTVIGDGAFLGCGNLIEIKVEEDNQSYLISEDGILYDKSVTRLIYCPKKRGSVEIPESVINIGDGAFEGCSGLTSVEIPEKVTSIGRYAFAGCSELTSMVIPEGVADIHIGTFFECSSLENITISGGVTFIGLNAFYGCHSLTSMKIPKSVTRIETNFCDDCDFLSELIVDDNNQNYASEKGILYNKEKTELIRCPCGKQGNVSVPEGVTEIGSGAFQRCNSLMRVKIPKSVTDIGGYAFAGYSELILGVYRDSYAETYAKENKIPYVIICKEHTPEVTEAIEPTCGTEGKTEGSHCSVCGEILVEQESVPATGKHTPVTDEAIEPSQTDEGVHKGWTEGSHCSACGKILVAQEVIPVIENDGWLTYENVSGSLVIIGDYSNGDIWIPSEIDGKKVAGIRARAFDGFYTNRNQLTSVEISEGVTYIGERAFSNLDNLKRVEIPASVTSIGKGAFKSGWYECDMVFWVNRGSYAEEYAKQEKIKYRYIGEECGHFYQETKVTKATPSKNGKITKKCSVCEEVMQTTTIYYPKTITLAKTNYIYNGKAQKPSVTIKDSKGKTITSSNYAVTYPSGRKNVGTYTVTIKFKNNYTGTMKKTFTIQPKGTSLSSVSAKSKSFTAKWKKQSTQTTGYEIQYSTDSKFKKGNKVQDVKKNQTTSQNVTKLKAGKKYYVRIRTYKTVKVSGKSKKIYSDWSKTKSVTAKK